MSVVTVKLPDVGEGIAEAELVEWSVAVGDLVREDAILAAVMTDKTTVEIPSPVEGTILWLGGEVGQKLAIGSALVKLEVAVAGKTATPLPVAGEEAPAPEAPVAAGSEPDGAAATAPVAVATETASHLVASDHPLAAPPVRLRARNGGVDLSLVKGTGPAGRITHEDLDAYLSGRRQSGAAGAKESQDTVREKRVTGLRRKIAERMAEASRRIPHITIVEEVDVTALEALRQQLNAERREDRPKLTVLPFLMAAIAAAVREQPMMNAHFDDEAELIREFDAVHIGIATQTKAGLMVPVVRHCEHMSLWAAAAELARVVDAARSGKAVREELSGSTITISSLGPLGAIATTPIINRPEVAIVGVNRIEIRPRWDGSAFVPRTMMNLSSSFDHRVIDGWDAALFVQRLKILLESPALIFVER